MPLFEWACRTAELRAPSSKIRALIQALQSNPLDASRLMGLTAGTVFASDFFQPENLSRIMTAGG